MGTQTAFERQVGRSKTRQVVHKDNVEKVRVFGGLQRL